MTIKRTKKYNKLAFTLVEVLVAAGIFSLFCVGLFSFYRMGSNIFVKGSWKLRKQKEAERFLAAVKERIEQTSNATVIDPAAANQIETNDASFVTLNNGSTIGSSTPVTSNTRLMIFSVCKPDLSKINPTKRGIILHNCLMLVPDTAKNLYTLYFGSRKSKDAIKGIDFFNSPTNYDPAPPVGGDFSASPQQYSLGADPQLLKLTDVSAVKIDWGIASGTNAATETAKIVGLYVEMQNPKYPSTKLQQRMQAKLDFTMTLTPKAVGDI